MRDSEAEAAAARAADKGEAEAAAREVRDKARILQEKRISHKRHKKHINYGLFVPFAANPLPRDVGTKLHAIRGKVHVVRWIEEFLRTTMGVQFQRLRSLPHWLRLLLAGPVTSYRDGG